MQKEPTRFKGMPQQLTHERLVETYNDTIIAAFTHMTKDKSAIELKFKDYIARIKAHPEEKLYARAIPDIHNMILDRIVRVPERSRTFARNARNARTHRRTRI